MLKEKRVLLLMHNLCYLKFKINVLIVIFILITFRFIMIKLKEKMRFVSALIRFRHSRSQHNSTGITKLINVRTKGRVAGCGKGLWNAKLVWFL